MLLSLYIRNFALIDSLELHFSQGFSVITGETGSGKSILLGALGLIMGDRADFSLIGPGGDKSVTEALFKVDTITFSDWFEQHDLDLNEEILIRREVHLNGKSRAFINDTPVSISVLKELSGFIFYIHSQYNTVELKSARYQLELLDALAGIEPQSSQFTKEFLLYAARKKELNLLKNAYEEQLKKNDYETFQCEEIRRLNPELHRFEDLEMEWQLLTKSEEVKALLETFEFEIHGENRLLETLKKLEQRFGKLNGVHQIIRETEKRIHALILELKDLSLDVAGMIDEQHLDSLRKDFVEGILDDYYRILAKHQLKNQEELLNFYDELKNRKSHLDERLARIESEEEFISKKETELVCWAKELHELRLNASRICVAKILEVLALLKMSASRLEFRLEERKELNEFGFSKVNILFSANQGVDLVPIEQAASGGELSRVMLALQHVLSEKKKLPTIFFDEIDTGVSGEVAEKIGLLLSAMGKNSQLIAITHLPQVAAKGEYHFKVEKVVLKGRAQSSVRQLKGEERTEEIARLLSGEIISQAALDNAKALMG